LAEPGWDADQSPFRRRGHRGQSGGLPLAVVLEAANRTDMIVAAATLDAVVIARPQPDEAHPQHLSLDAGYDYESTLDEVHARGYIEHVRPNWWNRNHGHRATADQLAHAASRQAGKRPRRWVVERLHAWLHRNRRLLIRWDKLPRCYLAFLCLANALICFQQAAHFQARALPLAA